MDSSTRQDLAQDEGVAKAYLADPLVKQFGTLRGIGDMLNTVSLLLGAMQALTSFQGEAVVEKYVQNWPVALPVSSLRGVFHFQLLNTLKLLIVHGEDDKVRRGDTDSSKT